MAVDRRHRAGDFFGYLAALELAASFSYPRLATVMATPRCAPSSRPFFNGLSRPPTVARPSIRRARATSGMYLVGPAVARANGRAVRSAGRGRAGRRDRAGRPEASTGGLDRRAHRGAAIVSPSMTPNARDRIYARRPEAAFVRRRPYPAPVAARDHEREDDEDALRRDEISPRPNDSASSIHEGVARRDRQAITAPIRRLARRPP